MDIKTLSHPKFGDFRFTVLENVNFFVARDYAAALRYARPEAFVNRRVSKENKILRLLRAKNSSVVVKTTFVNEKGIEEMTAASAFPAAQEIRDWLFEQTKRNTPQVITIENVHGYIDEKGVAWLNVEDVARGLGYVDYQEKISATSGRKTYEIIRWARINGYLAEFDYPPVKAGDFIPENIFYLLAMKANNAAAKTFQLKVANDILPSIRKYGFYSVDGTAPANVDFAEIKKELDEIREMLAAWGLIFQQAVAAFQTPTPFERADKILAAAEKISDPELHDKATLLAINFILGKNIF